MLVREFANKICAMNRKLVVVPGPFKVFGLYLYQPRHPDAKENGLVHVGAISAPAGWLGGCPKKKIVLPTSGMMLRGYLVTLRMLVDKGILPKSSVTSVFGSSWRVA